MGFLGCEVRTTHVTGTLTDIGSILGRIAVMYLRKGSKWCVMDDLHPRVWNSKGCKGAMMCYPI